MEDDDNWVDDDGQQLDPRFLKLLGEIDAFFMRDENGTAEKMFDEFAVKHAHHFEDGFD